MKNTCQHPYALPVILKDKRPQSQDPIGVLLLPFSEAHHSPTMKLPDPVSVLELRRLLIELNDKRPDICFRFRFPGEMWRVHFMRIIHVTEKGLMLHDEISDTQVLALTYRPSFNSNSITVIRITNLTFTTK